jgi:hypothetical protein
MAGYDPAKAARMNALAQQYPGASLSTLATLANVAPSDVGNYSNDSVGTIASNTNFGRVTSEESQTVQSSNAAPRINPVTGRAFVAPVPTPVDETAAFEQEFDGAGQTPTVTTTTPALPISTQNNTNSFGSAGSQDAFRGTTLPPAQAQDTDVDFTDAYGENFRQATPIPTPVVQPTDTDVDFDDAYGESFREVTPIPPSTRQPGVEQATIPPGSRGSGEFLDDRGRAPAEQPDPFPATPPARPAQSISQVDDFSGTGITQVDDFGGPSRNITQVDDFSGSAVPVQVDDFAEFQAPAQVDDFSAYSNNNFGQVDDFAEINTPAQVDDFSAYSNNDFGTEDPGLDAFGPGPTPPPPANIQEYDQTQFDPFGDVVEDTSPVQVDDFADYSNNDFGAQVDDFGDPTRNPAQVDDFSAYSNNDFGNEDFSDFATNDSPSDVNQFGVDDFGDAEAAQFDAFGDPLRSPAPVAEFNEFGDPINPQVTSVQFDEFGDPIDPVANRVDNDGQSLVGDDPDADIGDGADGEGIDGVEQAALSNAQTQAINAQAMKTKAQNQQTINEMREASGVKNADGDWRVKLRLAPQADYLYKAIEPGILAPLAVTDGIIFPYTPTIDVQYRAEYNNYQPTHSNYMHYFYKGSSVQTVQLQADFTAQDTKEAEYLLACMHFLKSASKMFYGQDAQRGSPPPLLYLTGLGEYQFNEQPCVVSEFNLNLPSDVNYIRARSRHINRDDQLQFEKPLATSITNGNFSALNRLKTAVTNALNGGPQPLQVGAKPFTPSPGKLGSKGATYVPTKMSMTINLLPIASRQQVSQQFSLKEYANGNLIKKGMW